MDNKILIGSDIGSPIFEFTNASIESCSAVLSSAMSGEELAIDQFMPVVYDAAYISVNFIPKNSAGLRTADGKTFNVKRGTQYLDQLPYGTPIWYYSGDNLIGKFYSQRIVRTGKAKFDVLAVSAVGILDGQQHNGGIYTGQTFAAVAGDIIGDQFAFTCADDVAGISIVGWLPIGTRRSNLHQLLFACGVALYKDADGEIVFRFPDTGTVKNIPDNRIFLGGNVDYQTPATKAEVTEHTFLASPVDEEVTLYDNTNSETANHVFVTFRDSPVYDLAVTDTLTIEESGVNYAIVSGTGTLTGKKYSHITRVLSAHTDDAAAVEKAVSVTEATLVNVANSENVLKRVLSYYSSAKIIRNDIVLEGELAGDQVSFNNPYNEAEQAFISSLDITASSFLRASCEMITGYFPSGGGNNYKSVMIITESGEFQLPDAEKGLLVLIGGGEGGWSGGNGFPATGTAGDEWGDPGDIGDPGAGGVAGKRGSGGKILSVKVTFSPNSTAIASIGVGGDGGTPNGTESGAGQLGTETTCLGFSSDDGATSTAGYLDIFNNHAYGVSGIDGYVGGAGFDRVKGDVPSITYNGQTWYASTVIGESHSGVDIGSSGNEYPWAFNGGSGGGPAVGSNGNPGHDADTSYSGKAGAGGDGADAAAPAAVTNRGNGGNGGHGGGGGGQQGLGSRKDAWGAAVARNGGNGAGGRGSDGSKGGDGIILLFY